MSSGGDFGPAGPSQSGAPPFAVGGPSTLSLDESRSGTGSYTVSNVTGRPVRARLLVLPGAGADAGWFRIEGETERPLPIAGTATVDVAVTVPPGAPAGPSSFQVGAALEEAPDQVVSGPTVSFTVPESAKRPFPWWIVIVAAVALVVLIGGGIVIWMLTRTVPDPVLSQPPAITGTAEVGQELAVAPGAWDPDDIVRVHVWQACPETATDEDDDGCSDILLGEEGDAVSARGPTYVVGEEVEGMRIRVVETALRVDPEALGEDGPENVSDLPQASATSALTDPVIPAPPTTAVVPNVVGSSIGDAQSALSQAGLQILATTSSEVGVCNPPVEDQNPDAGTEVPIGSVVAVTSKQSPPITTCLSIGGFDDVIIWDGWLIEDLIPSG